ncbi:methyltransferase domain-containing protein [Synechococcus sp. UW179B]|uniref:class I SAM-dependent methyltransferase n=1 Tax=Synechococcus sp. UW179B TaxID=2575516 RepID=UPI000E0E5AAA|nr:methyltransferase domain-containing protein [Synechococcus sp. UW179B]
MKKRTCAACEHENMQDRKNELDLKNIPPVDFYMNNKNKSEAINRYPIGIYMCNKCGLVQVKESPGQELFYENYIYESSSSTDMKDNFQELIRKIEEYRILDESVNILDIGCNDGLLLKEIMNKNGGVSSLAGIDPSPISESLKNSGIRIEKNYFPNTSLYKDSEFDIIISTNAFAHIPKIGEATAKVSKLLKEDGLFIVEVSDFDKMNELKAWDYIYHEHLFYYTKNSLSELLEAKGLTILEIQQIDTKGGSIRAIAKKTKKKIMESKARIDKSNAGNMKSIVNMEKSYEQWKKDEKLFFENNTNTRFIGYGACATASVTVAQSENFNNLICIIDDNKKRQRNYVPSTSIEVTDLEDVKFTENDIIIVFAWRFIKEISKKIRKYCKTKDYPEPKLFRSIDMKEWRMENE